MIDANEKIRQVELLPYDPAWQQLFAETSQAIAQILADNCIAIHHIGSTAVPTIYAKPIVDMLPVVKDIRLVDALNPAFEALGFVCMGEYGIEGRRFYWQAKPARLHHIHLFQQGSPQIARHVGFKNFLNTHADYAQAYSTIKRCLADVFRYDIENYVKGKASFVQMVEYQAGLAKPAQRDAQDIIQIQPYDSTWPKLAEAEINAIKIIGKNLPYHSIEHLGSTAVPELASKPIIDLFITVNSINQAVAWIAPLTALGYCFWQENPDKSHLRFFKGMPPYGTVRTHHVHIVEASDDTVGHRILFRDILRTDRAARLSYEELKRQLADTHASERESYTEGKTGFIKGLLRKYGYRKTISR